MGFNGVRKHQKIEDPRYLYWADRLGLLVWEEMPSAYRFTAHRDRARSRANGSRRSSATAATPASSPGCRSTNPGACPTCRAVVPQRHFVQALYHLTKTLDPTRPVIGNDGWESVATDIIGIHDYDADPDQLRRATARRHPAAQLFSASRPAGGSSARRRPAPRPADHAHRVRRDRLRDATGAHWGYMPRGTAERAARALRALMAAVRPHRAAGRLLLHAVRRHLPGSQRPALRRPHAEVSARRHRGRDHWRPVVPAWHRSWTRRARPDAGLPAHPVSNIGALHARPCGGACLWAFHA